jgi:hypothetical protein
VGYVEIPDAQDQHHVHKDTERMPSCSLSTTKWQRWCS